MQKFQLALDVDSGEKLLFNYRYLLNVGYAGRNQDAVKKHIDELANLGVPGPKRIPTVYPVGGNLLTTGGLVQVQHAETSGEVEYAIIVNEDNLFITVGSDHSDRLIEQQNIPWAKQAYPNVIASQLWDYNKVKDHLDEIIIRSWVSEHGEKERILYQEGRVADLLPWESLAELAIEVLGNNLNGLVLFSGTIPTIDKMICGSHFWFEMEDQHTGRSISGDYRIEILPKPIE